MESNRSIVNLNICGPVFLFNRHAYDIVEVPAPKREIIANEISSYGDWHDKAFPNCTIKFGDRYYE